MSNEAHYLVAPPDLVDNNYSPILTDIKGRTIVVPGPGSWPVVPGIPTGATYMVTSGRVATATADAAVTSILALFSKATNTKTVYIVSLRVSAASGASLGAGASLEVVLARITAASTGGTAITPNVASSTDPALVAADYDFRAAATGSTRQANDLAGSVFQVPSGSAATTIERVFDLSGGTDQPLTMNPLTGEGFEVRTVSHGVQTQAMSVVVAAKFVVV